jgi:KDO2-lipid IV(A) lauroyltransferase
VVIDNLKHAFPDKSEQEVIKIAKSFYADFCDFFIENIIALYGNEAHLKSKINVIINEYLQNIDHSKPIFLVFGHQANWEWALFGINKMMQRPMQAMYKKLRDKNSDTFMLKLRSKFGNTLLEMNQAPAWILRHQKEPLLICAIADQTPMRHQIHYWADFLHRPTPFYTGWAKIASKINDSQVYYLNFKRAKQRRTFEISILPIKEKHEKLNGDEITDRFVLSLAQFIQENPQQWLWSHKKWKYSKQDFEIPLN